MPQILVENVTKEYPTRGEPLVVLREVSLELSTGENVAILGPSGSGKSTLLNILGTLEPPTSGRVVLDGVDPAGLDSRQLAELRGRKIGLVFQEHYLLPQCSAMENVLVPTVAPRGRLPLTPAAARRNCWIGWGWGDRIEQSAGRNSPADSGQRVALARALINRPVAPLGRRADRQSRPRNGQPGRRLDARTATGRGPGAGRRHPQPAGGRPHGKTHGAGRRPLSTSRFLTYESLFVFFFDP